jgi:predicted nucleic acid-binding protein
MSAPVFVDTNVLIYCLDEADPSKYEIARLWRAELWKSRLGRLSFQVLQEFYWVGTQKWPALGNSIQAEIRDLLEWRPVVIDSQLLETSWKIQEFILGFADCLSGQGGFLPLSADRRFAGRSRLGRSRRGQSIS